MEREARREKRRRCPSLHAEQKSEEALWTGATFQTHPGWAMTCASRFRSSSLSEATSQITTLPSSAPSTTALVRQSPTTHSNKNMGLSPPG